MNTTADASGKARSIASRFARSAFALRTLPVWLAGGAVAVLLVAVIVAGGLNGVQTDPTALGAGDGVRTPLYTVTVLDAELTDEIEEQFLSAEPGEIVVVLTLRLENLSDRAIGVGRSADQVESRLINVTEPLLQLSDVTSSQSTRVWRTDGSGSSVVLQPDVPSELRMAWIVPEDAFPEGVVRLDVYDAEESTGQIILSADHVTWWRTELAARISVEAKEGP